MAGGGIISGGAGRNYPGRLTKKVLVTCIVAAFGGLIFGYDLGISGGVTSMDSFLSRFFPKIYEKEHTLKPSSNQYCTFNSQTLTLFTSSLYLAALFSSMIASSVTRVLGRKVTMVSAGILFFIGGLINAISSKQWMLYVGRIFLGLGIGCANQSVPIYVSETAPYKSRGKLNIMFQLCITIGILVANVLNYFFAKIENYGWRLSVGGAMVPAVIITIGSLVVPDTPNSMIERNQIEKAKNQLIKLRGVANVDDEFNDLLAASERSKLVKHPWIAIFERKYRPQLTFAVLIPAFQQLTGNNVFVFYAPVLFKTMGFGSSASLMSAVITNGVNFVATIVSIILVDRAGRRKLFIAGGIQMFAMEVLITVAIAWKFGLHGTPGDLPKWYAYSVVAAICVFVAAFAWSWGPLGWLVPSEIFPLEIRSAAQSINVGVNMIMTFLIAQVTTWMLCHMKFGLFIFYGFWAIVMNTFIYKYLPETKGIPIEEMQTVWQKHPKWTKYVGEYEPPVADEKDTSA